MNHWAFLTFLTFFATSSLASQSILDKVKGYATQTWETAQSALIYDDEPVRRYAEPITQQIRQRVAHERRIYEQIDGQEVVNFKRYDGVSCINLALAEQLETNFIEKCDVNSIVNVCRSALSGSSRFFDDIAGSEFQSRFTTSDLRKVHDKTEDNLGSIIDARELCYNKLSAVRKAHINPNCMSTLQDTLSNMSEDIVSSCTEEDFRSQIDRFAANMRLPGSSAHQVINASAQYVAIRKTEIELSHQLASLKSALRARLANERATASSSTTTSNQSKGE